jgi:hypothetical protein
MMKTKASPPVPAVASHQQVATSEANSATDSNLVVSMCQLPLRLPFSAKPSLDESNIAPPSNGIEKSPASHKLLIGIHIANAKPASGALRTVSHELVR